MDIKHVISVEPLIVTADDHIQDMRLRQEMRQKLYDFIVTHLK